MIVLLISVHKEISICYPWATIRYLIFSVVVLQQEKRLFTNFHRQLFCWIDKWIELNMDDIRRMEEETRRELDEVSQQKYHILPNLLHLYKTCF